MGKHRAGKQARWAIGGKSRTDWALRLHVVICFAPGQPEERLLVVFED